ncbi:hypothetical protein [Methanoculleus sp. MH98A]|uniref:hypothetical protein n=1 Tax=Methanoculleus sp. MH98A TaxID=1495314 RepID=UPI00049F0868|nr:hypothetical protein [Methanoculleus sp. MH98A]KDE54464.1 hypothetical protein EI28_01345 [Methanoculleus sp. MH98A]
MHRRLPIVLLALVVAQVFLCGCISGEPEYLHTSLSYELYITTDTRIENVTLLVPVPARGDRPAIGHDPISDAFYTDPESLRSGLPDNHTLAIVPVDGQYYLRLTAPYMDPARPIHVDYYNYTSFRDKFRPEIVPQLIETRHPFGNESLFLPKQNLTLTASSSGTPNERGYYDPDGYRYSYTIPIYAQYENGTKVTIYSHIWGLIEWSDGFDNTPVNEYSDTYRLVVKGEPQGWMPAGGEMTAGKGIYREWQLNASPTSGAGK